MHDPYPVAHDPRKVGGTGHIVGAGPAHAHGVVAEGKGHVSAELTHILGDVPEAYRVKVRLGLRLELRLGLVFRV